MSEEQLVTLQEIFTVVFNLSPGVDLGAVRQGETESWDSLAHVTLVTAMESEFGIEVSPTDSIEMTSFDAATEIIAELLSS